RRAVLQQDSSSYVSANNLAVLLAERGDYMGARRLLKSAIASAPDYAKAWHNLAVVETRTGANPITDIESAFATAGRLSREARGDDAELIIDDTVYQSGVDISKALAP